MNETLFPSETRDFELVFEEKYTRVLINAELKIIICELLADDVPIEDFKEAF